MPSNLLKAIIGEQASFLFLFKQAVSFSAINEIFLKCYNLVTSSFANFVDLIKGRLLGISSQSEKYLGNPIQIGPYDLKYNSVC